MDVLQAVAAHAAATPARVAHRWSGGQLTWGGLWDAAGSLAGRLAATLERDGSPVVVHAHKQSLAVVAMLACARAGHPYVPLDDSIAPGRLAATVAAASAPLVLAVSPLHPDAHLPAGCEVWEAEAVGAAAASGAPAPPDAHGVHGGSTIYVIFTSGSTGEPKGVQISADNLASFLAWVTTLLPPTAGHHTFLNQAPWSFDLSVMDTWTSLVTGGTLVSLDRDQVGHQTALVHALADSAATVWVSTPSFATLCLASAEVDAGLLDVGAFLFCGETLPAATAAELLVRFPRARVLNTYGPTEATVAVTSVEITPRVVAASPHLPVGYPKPGCRLSVRDEAGAELPAGRTGEIWIHGDTVSAGYLGRPDLTAVAFAPAEGEPTYRTGDLGRLEDGCLHFAGRRDHQVKLHGYRIELGDVEANLAALPAVGACVVLARGDGETVTHLEAVVQLAHPATPKGLVTTLALRRELGERLPGYMVPKAFTYRDALPLTANGKVDRAALERPAATGAKP